MLVCFGWGVRTGQAQQQNTLSVQLTSLHTISLIQWVMKKSLGRLYTVTKTLNTRLINTASRIPHHFFGVLMLSNYWYSFSLNNSNGLWLLICKYTNMNWSFRRKTIWLQKRLRRKLKIFFQDPYLSRILCGSAACDGFLLLFSLFSAYWVFFLKFFFI